MNAAKHAAIELGGDGFSIGIGRKSGRMESLDLCRADFGRWNTIPGRLEILDELKPGHYVDGRDPCDVTVSLAESGSAVVTKRFHDACFGVREEWTVE